MGGLIQIPGFDKYAGLEFELKDDSRAVKSLVRYTPVSDNGLSGVVSKGGLMKKRDDPSVEPVSSKENNMSQEASEMRLIWGKGVCSVIHSPQQSLRHF